MAGQPSVRDVEGKSSSSLTKRTVVYKRTKWGWGRAEAPVGEVLAFRKVPWKLYYALLVSLPSVFVFVALGMPVSVLSLLLLVVLGALLAMPVLGLMLWVHCRVVAAKTPLDQSAIIWKDAAFERKWKGRKIPVEFFYEAYFAQKIDLKGDLMNDVLYNRYSIVEFVFTMSHFRFFLFQLIPELLAHTRNQDTDQVRDHYDRGNDFYRCFLGETMIYTSGIFQDENDTLEEAQRNKLDLVLNKIHLQKGERHLDIGCGWGTLLVHAAKNYGSDSTGITLARNQTEYANEQIAKAGLSNSARALCMDYRDIPTTPASSGKYHKITCLEMAEHVGIKYFQSFMRQVYDMLEDDGLFYLQIAGLRRAFQYEDLVWGLFMGKYVFPGADASCPLAWVIHQAEGAGFEVHSVETIGVHYSATIKRWYDNWCSPANKALILKNYGEKWWRKWAWFLGWAVCAAEQGSATCYMIVMHKNTRAFDRKGNFIAERAKYKI